jgi:DNA-binding transcriptional regulator YhcF (GntR family)
MEFREKQSIYLQIADYFTRHILEEQWKADEKVPSVRQLAVDLEVNPNTVMRTYNFLQDNGVIYNKRGIGYFVSQGARERIVTILRNKFLNEELQELFKTMELLKISFQELESHHVAWKKNKKPQEDLK